jgi:LmbE family N-acetylglucosaminyl deacetylase
VRRLRTRDLCLETSGKALTHLFLFPHQDDEFGVFHLLDEQVKRGYRVVCVYLTDGVAGTATARQRNAESSRVLARSGIGAPDILFLGTDLSVRDGALVDNLDCLFDATLQIAVENSITSIHVPAWEGGHPDHDAAVLLGRALAGALKLHGQLWQFALYNAYQVGLVPLRILYPLPENGRLETFAVSRAARLDHLARCLAYPSQWKTWAVLLPMLALRYQLSPQQVLQPVLDERLSRRPHAGALLYERRNWTTWDQQMTKSRGFRARHYLS